MTPLNNKQHANLKIQHTNDVSRFKNQHLIPITVQDFIPLSTEFPIVFVKNEDTGQFTSVAVMGIRSGINLYCQDVEWTCAVAPVGFHNAPLSLVKTSDNSDEVTVCFDEKSSFISTDSGEALFDEQGLQTEFLNKKKLNVKLAREAEPMLLSGIYLINEKVLNALPIQEFEELRSQGLLPLIYAHLASLHQITRLTIKQNEFEAK